MHMNNQRQKIYLAALLHDIGKFYQRASGSMNSEKSNLSKQSIKIRDYICPTKHETGEFSHLHTVWTNEFFEQKQKIFGNIQINNEKPFYINPWDENKLIEDNIANLASNHHKPYSELQKLISIADGWSAGIDRKEMNEEDKKNTTLKFNSFKEIPLFSVFNILKTGKEKKKGDQNIAYPLRPLKLERDTIFPKKIDQEGIESLQEQYADLWKNFFDDFDRLPTDSFDGFEESLLFLLKKYTWAIPSNTMDMANVSLFDHLKTTAAIADCLYITKNDEEFSNAFNLSSSFPTVNKGYYPIMLVGVDISGIQSFIYDIASSKAAKSLKGRSFYLQLLAEAMLMKFKKHNDIKARSAHVLYASGGKFYLLLPNTEKIKNALDKIKEETEEALWKEHKGKLSVNISYIGFAHHSEKRNNSWVSWLEIEGFENKEYQLNKLWKALADKITRKKEQKFATVVTDKFDELFNEKNEKLCRGGEVKTCIVTGEELLIEETVIYNKIEVEKENAEPKYTTQTVIDQTELGKALKDADYLIAFKGNKEDDTYLNNRAKAKITVLDTNYYLFDKLELIDNEAEFRRITSVDVSGVYMLNNTDFLNAKIKGQKVSYGFRFYGGNEQAYLREKNGEIKTINLKRGDIEHTIKKEKTFQELSKTDDNDNTLLGILRMDVDNLGKLFVEGFDDNNMSFSAFSTLSFHLDLFFSGYLNKLRNSDDFKDWVNILYSGGDDLFVVGRWDKIIDFAELVRKEFTEYTKRQEIGISGGLSFVHEKFPISKAAQMAGIAESASKNYPDENPFDQKDKNAITFFGETINWDKEFDIVKNLKGKLYKYISKKNKPISKAILHKLIQYRQIKDKHLIFNKEKKDYSFLWHTAYYFKRYTEKYDPKKNNEEKEIVNFLNSELKDKLFSSSQNNYRYYELAALAARWAEMELKYNKKKQVQDGA